MMNSSMDSMLSSSPTKSLVGRFEVKEIQVSSPAQKSLTSTPSTPQGFSSTPTSRTPSPQNGLSINTSSLHQQYATATPLSSQHVKQSSTSTPTSIKHNGNRIISDQFGHAISASPPKTATPSTPTNTLLSESDLTRALAKQLSQLQQENEKQMKVLRAIFVIQQQNAESNKKSSICDTNLVELLVCVHLSDLIICCDTDTCHL